MPFSLNWNLLVAIFYLVLVPLFLHAQNGFIDSFQSKIDHYNLLHSGPVLFIQTDKTIYSTNETIWFAGYILQNTGEQEVNIQADVLSVALVGRDTKEIVLQKNYLIQKNLCSGSLLIPDSLMPGQYDLVAFVNLVKKDNKPIDIFRQTITIKSDKKPPFTVDFKILDTFPGADPLRIEARLSAQENIPASTATIAYHLQGHAPKIVKPDKYGKGLIAIPRADINRFNHTLITTTSYKNEVQHFNLRLPEQEREQTITTGFYPEGGDMVTGLRSRIIWETKSGLLQPIQAAGVLLENGRIIDTIQTNKYGVGIFELLPKPNAKYTVKLPDTKLNIQNREFSLPVALNNGIVLEVKNAIVNDSLKVLLKSIDKRVIKIAVSNGNYGFVTAPMIINKTANLMLNLGDVPKGIGTLTILDEADSPLAERLFFAHFDRKNDVDITTGKYEYKLREKVNLTLSLTDPNKMPLGGIYTIACVQNNRIDFANRKDIESYYYFEHLFDHLPTHASGRFYDDKPYLEETLLLKGWRRYTWQNLMQPQPADTIRKTMFMGQVYKNDKLLKEAKNIVLMRDSIVVVLTTDTKGGFVLNPENSTVPEGRNSYLRLLGEQDVRYTFRLNDPLAKTMQRQVDSMVFLSLDKPALLQSFKQTILDGYSKNVLPEVVVKTNKDNSFLSPIHSYGPNACGDYVCRTGYLNCPHRDEPLHIPIKGTTYKLWGGGYITYMGCIFDKISSSLDKMPSFYKMKPIYNAREFYGMDSTTMQQTEPQYMSTIFWKPFVVSGAEQQNFSFYTSDIKGAFRIIIQGVGNNGDMIFKEKIIKVVE